MLILLWWLWALYQLAKNELPDVVWPGHVIEEREREEWLTRRLVFANLLLVVILGVVYAIVISNVEASSAALTECRSLFGVGDVSEVTRCSIENAETFARANESASWVTIFFWIAAVI